MIAILAASPPLLRALGAGVSPPPSGVAVELWLGWEVALFLVAASLFIATRGGRERGARRAARASAVGGARARDARRRDRAAWCCRRRARGPPGIAWSGWLVIATLALTRSHRRLVLVAGGVAALVATTLTWGAGVRGRATLADRDVAGLAIVEPDIVSVLQRLGADLRALPGAAHAKRSSRSDTCARISWAAAIPWIS